MPSYKDKLPIQTTINFDTIPTIGSTNAVTSGGIYNSLLSKQDVLTNPVTGTGTAGQVAYFSGTSAVTGSANLFWDAANGRLGIGTNAPTQKLEITAGNIIIDNNSEYRSKSTGGSSLPVLKVDTSNNLLAGSVFLGSQFISYTSTSFRWYQYPGSVLTERMQLNAAGNLLIQNGGTFTDNGQRLQVYGSTLLRGSGTTSATTALLVQNSTPTALLTVRDDGGVYINNGTLEFGTVAASNPKIFGQNGLGVLSYSSPSGISIESNLFIGSEGYDIHLRRVTGTRNVTTGTNGYLALIGGYAPTSGTGTYVFQSITGTINQTGGANGITRGLYVNPTLTAAADWRSIETSNNTGYAIYTAGTANSYFGGNVGVGTATPTSKLHIVDTLTTTADLYTSVNIAGTITSRNTAGDTIYALRSNQNLVATATNQKIIGADLNFGTTFFDTNTDFIGLKISGLANTQNTNTAFWAVQKSTAGNNGIVIQPNNNRWVIGFSTGQTTTIPGARVIYHQFGIYVSNDSNSPSAMLHVRGSGTTSATTALLVQNSTPTPATSLLINDDQQLQGYSGTQIRFKLGKTDGADGGQGISIRDGQFSVGYIDTGQNTGLRISGSNATGRMYIDGWSGGTSKASNYPIIFGSRVNNVGNVLTNSTTAENGTPVVFGSDVYDASSIVQINSTTRGFLPPRMTTTQKNAIATPAEGLVVYDSTNSSLDLYTSAWRSLISTSNADGINIAFGTTTGTKIGTATSQKIGLWNATPVAQPTTGIAEATFVENSGGTAVNVDSTFAGYTIQQIAQALKDIGLLA